MSRIDILARSFPTLRDAPGINPWDPPALDRWAVGPEPSSGALHAARFVLALWNDRVQWRAGVFELTKAYTCWDPAHRHAFLAWAQRPWWP